MECKVLNNICIGDGYTVEENEHLKIFVRGYVFSADGTETNNDLTAIAECVVSGALDFNKLIGFYRILVIDKDSQTAFFWGDNAGTMLFFYSEDMPIASDSLLAIADRFREDEQKLNIDKDGVCELMAFDSIVTERTVIEGIKKTDFSLYYILDDHGIRAESKKLAGYSTMRCKYSLYELCRDLLAIIGKDYAACTITGGTDSRAVLACLHKSDCYPPLVLTAHRGNPDIGVARSVAAVSGEHIAVIDPSEKEDNWIEQGFLFSDGNFDVVLGYRHLIKCRYLSGIGSRACFGGAAGEFYKNAFYKPFLNIRHNIGFSHETVVDDIFPGTGIPGFISEEIKNRFGSIRSQIISMLASYKETSAFTCYNAAGGIRLRGSVSSLANNISRYIINVDPLMEPSLIRSIVKVRPASLSMAMWLRTEIFNADSSLSEIPTDSGYSCSTRYIKVQSERLRKLNFWISRVTARLKRKLGFTYRDITQHYWDEDYFDAKKRCEFMEAFKSCIEMNIIDENTRIEDIPPELVGKILLIGQVINRYCRKGEGN